MVNDSLNKIHHRLNNDFPFFAEHAPLIIKDKSGDMIPFILNKAQLHIHSKLEEQLKKMGRVRALLLKGRQQGGSTYVGGRFFHKVRSGRGISAFILSHEGKTTDKLFRIVKRFHDNVHPSLQPEEGASNRNQMTYPSIEGDYTVGTAGNENVGRGSTSQLVHGSEAAYWINAYAIQDGLLESVGDAPGTEIILESTANGPVGLFYQKCMNALKGIGDYILIFVPWFWQDEYERPLLAGGQEITEEENIFIKMYLLDLPRLQAVRKILWRRAKHIELSTGNNIESGFAKFRQIYPSNPIEAFQSTGVGLVRPDAILAARKNELVDQVSPTVMGVDPAGDSDNADRTVIAIRRGRQLFDTIKYTRMRRMELAGIIARLIDRHGVDMVFIDRGYGEGTIDRLHELGYTRKVQGIAFNERTLYPDIYLNKRSEILIEAAKWINAGNVNIPDSDELHADLACMPLDEETSNGLKFLKSKREIKKLLGRSTDFFDAIGLTFAYPVRRNLDDTGGFRKATIGEKASNFKRTGGALKSRARRRGR